jgi:hypothetical protein
MLSDRQEGTRQRVEETLREFRRVGVIPKRRVINLGARRLAEANRAH